MRDINQWFTIQQPISQSQVKKKQKKKQKKKVFVSVSEPSPTPNQHLITTTQIIRDLDRILKHYIAEPEIRKLQVNQILLHYSKKSYIKYSLDDRAYLILSKVERKLNCLKRYKNSPFPLLSNLERFSQTIGSWNEELLQFGLKTREKLRDHAANEDLVGTKIYLSFYHTENSKCNAYLKRQYRRLEKYRSSKNITAYWKLSWFLMSENWSYRTASLNSWMPRWYKTLNWKEFHSLHRGLNRILNLEELNTSIYNV